MSRECGQRGCLLVLIFAVAQGVAYAQDQGQASIPAPSAPVASDAPRDPLLVLVEKAISVTSRRQLTAGVHTPWQVVHGILALRHDLVMKLPDGGQISGIEWMAGGALHEGQPLWEITPYGGRGHTFTKPYAFEGHPTQFMGYMSMSNLPLDFQFKVGQTGKTVTVADVVNDAKMQVREGPEVTWTLWALTHYLEPDAEWVNSAGEQWSIERMVQVETRQSVLSGACGGTHGLFALAYARNKHLRNGNVLRGPWLEADQKVQRYVQEARALQNPDGSFSAAFFRGPELGQAFAKRLPANGHVLEFLMMALPEERMKEEWVRRGVTSVAQDLVDNRSAPADCGPLYHALHALKLYNYRVNPASSDYGKQAIEHTVAKPVSPPPPAERTEKATPEPKAANAVGPVNVDEKTPSSESPAP